MHSSFAAYLHNNSCIAALYKVSFFTSGPKGNQSPSSKEDFRGPIDACALAIYMADVIIDQPSKPLAYASASSLDPSGHYD